MRSVHIIVGSTRESHGGEASEFWPVAAFTTKARAQTFAKRANDWIEARLWIYEDGSTGLTGYEDRRRLAATNPYDPNMKIIDVVEPYERIQVFLDPPLPTKEQGA